MACLYTTTRTTAKHVCTKLYILSCLLHMTSGAGTSDVSWPTVGIAWVLCTITTVIIMAGTLAVLHAIKRRRRRKNAPPRITRELSVVSEASDMTRVSEMSTHPLCNNGGPGGYKRVPSRESNINRRKSDFISAWCSKYGLSEVIAANLRENGFNSQKQLDSLQAGDVVTLGLPNLAQQVQLRGVLETVRKKTERVSPQQSQDEPDGPVKPEVCASIGSSNGHRTRSLSSERGSRPRSSTTEDTSLLASSPKQPSLSSNHTSFPFNDTQRSHTIGHIPSGHMTPSSHVTSSGHVTMSGHMVPSMITEELPYHPQSISYMPTRNRRPRLHFHGLLSDSGLYELAEDLGTEWRHLAAVLGVPKAQQEHILNDHPMNTKQQIYEMLRHWRENERGGKEQIKAVLNEGFMKIKRKDLAEKVLREQVHGSDEHLVKGTSNRRINSQSVV